MQTIYPEIQVIIEEITQYSIPEKRKEELNHLVQYIKTCNQNLGEVHLNFICTHNSRRSQFAQVWAAVAAFYYELNAFSYSGGVEITACNERTIASLERSGFRIQKGEGANPKYKLQFAITASPIQLWSKLFDDKENLAESFAAVMTCDHADENCPFIPGSEARISMNFEDPKAFDETNKEAEMYDERSKQIASELFWVFSQV